MENKDLQTRLRQLAERAQSDALRRAESLLHDNEEVLQAAVGSNGVVLLTAQRIVYSLGKGAVRQAGELFLQDLDLAVEKEEGNLLEALRLTKSMVLKGVGYEQAQEFIKQVQKLDLTSHKTDSQESSSGILLSLQKPSDYQQLVGLLERLSALYQEGFLSGQEFDRVKRYLLR